MKFKHGIKIYLLISLGIISSKAHAQNNSVFNLETGDSLTLGVEARGEVQWEMSADNQSWEELSGENDFTFSFVAERNTYYRARISDPDCDPVYSDPSLVRVIAAEDRPEYDSMFETRVKIGMMRWDGWAPDDNPVSAYNQCLEAMKPQKWNDSDTGPGGPPLTLKVISLNLMRTGLR